MAKDGLAALKGIFGDVDKLNPEGSILEDNALSLPQDWIDTGSYALNAILSGSLYKGIPTGRITGIQGPSQSGKSLIINKIIANAQKKGYVAVVWDSEAAIDQESARRIGVDPKLVKYYPVDTVEACRNQISKFLDNVIKAKIEDPELKFIIAIDSLGNLASSKELHDAEKDKEASDVGHRAKQLKSMMRTLTYKTAKAGVPIVFSNHIYDGMEMYPTLVKNASGGKGPGYLASILVQLSTKNEKTTDNPDEESIAIAHNVSGVTLGALTVKNRFIPAFLKTELYLNFKTGLDKYAGLFEIADGFQVIRREGNTYYLGEEKLGFRKNFAHDTEFWNKLLPTLEQTLQKELRYANLDIEESIAEIEEEISTLPEL